MQRELGANAYRDEEQRTTFVCGIYTAGTDGETSVQKTSSTIVPMSSYHCHIAIVAFAKTFWLY